MSPGLGLSRLARDLLSRIVGDLPDWWPDWSGDKVVVAASGPSMCAEDLDLVRGRARLIVVNRTWELAPWADMLFSSDWNWWKSVEGCPQFQGLRATTCVRAARELIGVQPLSQLMTNRVLFQPGLVGWGGCSGFQAFNLALQLSSTVALLGYDMSLEAGVHWHGRHEGTLRNPDTGRVRRWRQAMDDAARSVRATGRVVRNCSRQSALTGYERVSLREFLA